MAEKELKLCINCHYGNFAGPAAICMHDKAILTIDPVDGQKKHLHCDVMRRGSSPRCGMEAVFFKEKTNELP